MHLMRFTPKTTEQYVQAGGREADPGAGGYSDHGANIRVQCRPGYTLRDTQRWAGVVVVAVAAADTRALPRQY